MHTCATYSIAYHLDKTQPHVREACEMIIEEVEKFGPIQINPVKTTILLKTDINFLALIIKKDRVVLEFALDRQVDCFPIYKTVSISKRKTVHFIAIDSVEDVDTDLLSLLNEAYLLARKK
jgi:hypothetical protein